MPPQEEVEFKTIDGVALRGRLYPASDRGPGIVLSPGFNCVKEILGLPDVALGFQEAGITALVYDPRSTGCSDGIPRNDIDPVKQVEDYSDALTFLSGLPMVDPNRLAFWGMSFAGTVALCAASLDKRAKFVIAVCPLTQFQHTPAKIPKLLAKCMQDRESQLMGNPPLYLPVLTETGENPAGFGIGVDKEHFAKVVTAGRKLAPSHVNRTTIQSYYKLLMWQPSALWRLLDPTPVMFIVPALDTLCPPEVQLHCFEALSGPKIFHLEPQTDHMNILEGNHFAAIMKLQTDFAHNALEGRIDNV